MSRLILSVFVSVVLMTAAGTATAESSCGDDGFKRSCLAGSFQMNLMPQAKSENACGDKSACIPLDAGIGPAPAFITCEAEKGGYTCEAWPKGDLKYSWVLDEGLEQRQAGAKAEGSMRLQCSGEGGSSLMSVRVTAPNGLSETVFSQVQCGRAAANEAAGKKLALR